jgi:pimeloyl-ACP methyl ester carboxylesterase
VSQHSVILALVGITLLLNGCVSNRAVGRTVAVAQPDEPNAILRVQALAPEVRRKLLLLNPEKVTEREIQDLLSTNPAPRIINIHGGVLPIKAGMNSFAQFLIGMGYPEVSLRNPGNGSYTYGYYNRSKEIAGCVAWYYEHDGMRPMVVGHSQGGIQTIRVLYRLTTNSTTKVTVWNPVTRTDEKRYEIVDPLTGWRRPVAGLRVCYATAAVAGGLARFLPNEWDMNLKLRKIPDSVEDFTGFQKGMDLLGGDFLGFGSANDYRAIGDARVRNVRLPASSSHASIPYAEKLLQKPSLKESIANYDPSDPNQELAGSRADLVRSNARALWAAEVWHAIKKHWVLELQHLILAQSGKHNDS